MAAIKVVDASALAALLFGEPEGPEIAALLRGAPLVAPALLRFEMAQICLKKIIRHPAMRAQLIAAFEKFGRMKIDSVEVEHNDVLLLALRTGLTAYDASYLWLARNLEAELVTLDRQLEAAIKPRN
ncbi:MAG: type II toxin-antitoxin system VapC family toxin [Alphaproteobacteria bacterium]|nr:type II toxin-antitoxin system VapC family toxin [Alphaproteobacteria bacterium]